MRFIADGPSIPDELLTARDQGRVIFFCGAGVSRARAHLPDFFGLAEDVINRLRVPQNSAARKLIKAAQKLDKDIGVAGLVSADRVFGLLEREHPLHQIQEAVAQGLKPKKNCDLSAHRILLDLATTPDKRIQLVTTNFDRLFDNSRRGCRTWQPPRLPDPHRPGDMDGIVYLHGRARADYNKAEGDGFVLSTSEFGRAYLADGWATSFIRKLIDRFVIVFVGYSADDPPIYYLLEALNRASGKLTNVYALQSGNPDDAAARWRHKGVEAISYDSKDAHSALWSTLDAWAERARNPDAWSKGIVARARNGPKSLRPHERGQVAHLVSTVAGARAFADKDPPSAEWLCVFDASRRFEQPGLTRNVGQAERTYIDPFPLYGLDSDIAPEPPARDDYHARREIPAGSWNAFDLNKWDRGDLLDSNLPNVRGHWAQHVPQLPPRLRHLAGWIADVANQPTTVWWAAHQNGLHPDIVRLVRSRMANKDEMSHAVRTAWRLLLDARDRRIDDFHAEWFELRSEIKVDGWTQSLARRLCQVRRPFIDALANRFDGPLPPIAQEDLTFRQIISPDVEYPDIRIEADFQVPNEYLAQLVTGLRQNLELAISLETEIGGYGLTSLRSITPDSARRGDGFARAHGLSASLYEFSQLLLRLLEINVSAARREFAAWPRNDNYVFPKLLMWAIGLRKLASSADVERELDKLNDHAFWYPYHQRDLLLSLSERWPDITRLTRSKIETRLLNGPPKWPEESESQYSERRLRRAVERLTWLKLNGCALSVRTRRQIAVLQKRIPDWDVQHAESAAHSWERRGGWVKTEADPTALLAEPIESTLSKALAIANNRTDFLRRDDPFAGLAADRPVHALAALVHAAKRGDFPEWAWQKFLGLEQRAKDSVRMTRYIAARIVSYVGKSPTLPVAAVSSWLFRSGEKLAGSDESLFRRAIERLTAAISQDPKAGGSALIRGSREPDWNNEAINSPSGNLAAAMFFDFSLKDLKANAGLPADWKELAVGLLNLPNDARRYALVSFCQQLNWLYFIDRDWSETNLVACLEGMDSDDRGAAWSGLLQAARVPARQLYIRIKGLLLRLPQESLPMREEYEETIGAFVLAGWGTGRKSGSRLITDEEMREVVSNGDEEFRAALIWQAERWAREGGKHSSSGWAKLLLEFLRDVWPRQLSVRSSRVSARLLHAAFSNVALFPQMAKAVLPLLSKVEHDSVLLYGLRESSDEEDDIVRRYPKQALDLLFAALSENVQAWPYGMGFILKRMVDSDPSLASDDRYLALKQLWDAR